MERTEWVSGVRIQIAARKDREGLVVPCCEEDADFWAVYLATGDTLEAQYRQFEHVGDFDTKAEAEAAASVIEKALKLSSRFYLKTVAAVAQQTGLKGYDEQCESWEDAIGLLADAGRLLDDKVSENGAVIWPERADWYETTENAALAFSASLKRGVTPDPEAVVNQAINTTIMFGGSV